ncbi:ATP-dependent RNA helicase HrpA [Paucibacter sp. Y2R2-4]|uniref:ATP-dependent RNA helicase HrpA n=1 Tax=Paucibacter sp. Y2R2-4 TaxID=2893553 RepID=UPI0021E4AA01|nr:ATP-dependent RNA helicase HrpA [Paucibacter sp. Y2R2-4]MCV2349014.1 ATP-dependent RNA helicase HrpA [Paucibacter sp. Y2R2-4]
MTAIVPQAIGGPNAWGHVCGAPAPAISAPADRSETAGALESSAGADNPRLVNDSTTPPSRPAQAPKAQRPQPSVQAQRAPKPPRPGGVAEARRPPVPANPLPPITFPESLPVSSRREDIAQALAEHQVIIVCGETGSGKTTQLPKIALALGRGRANTGKLIGHTQPRRIAASSVAKRIADELKTPLGEIVGYKVRFQDRLQPGASVKLMTDGILLAETQTDPLLKAYDTIIIDEAHERSLNIDFLLGYLRQILPRRPDLKIIVTSATIDADRFAKHFESIKGPAPVLMVSGRTFPVEQRYRPFEESREYDLNNAICDAVDELWREGGGDVLVFLPGEREIREAAEALRKHHPPGVEVLPLFARLSQQEQDRVFEPHGQRRIVLATNVAETSLTVPGIRYVIDPGMARVKRYSYRNKVEQLQIEPVSQSSANQRAGRCGRVSNGICIRLYEEKDYLARPRFTDPEILRSSLAGVILRMKTLGLGQVDDFPFLEPPPRKAIADGYQLLTELGAVDEANELTAMGRELGKLPLDPRVGRMILEARSREALAEILVIASALSGQDVRDRPMEQQQAADEKHKKFDDEKSEFLGYLKLWKWIEEAKGGHGEHKLSNRRYEQLLRENFVSPRRVREWRDVYSQLHTVVAEHGWRINGSPATYEQVHLSMLAGLLGNLGCKSDEDEWYLGARGIKFWRHPGAHLSKKPGRWIVAAELVDTTRLFGRGIAAIEPQWLPGIAGHLIKTQLLEPHWEKKAAEVIALERATLYGIVIYNNRRVNFGNVDAAAARAIFIREALVNGEWESRLPFLAHNQRQIRKVEELEHKSRRQDVLVDDELIYAYYDEHLPADVYSGATFERWYRHASKTEPKLLQLSVEELMRHEAAGITSSAFPKTIRLGGVDCLATYLHEPGDARDGLTVSVPIYALNQVNEDRCEWLVPGMLEAKVLAFVKSLHQRPRSRLVPLPDFVAEFAATHPFGQGALIEVLLKAVKERTQLAIQRNDFKLEQLQPHLFMNFLIVDEHGRQLGIGRNLAALKAELGGQARSAFQALAALKLPASAPSAAAGKAEAPAPVANGGIRAEVQPKKPVQEQAKTYTGWTFGELPELMEVSRGAQTLIGFPALIDRGAHVEIEVFDEPDVAAAKHRLGLRRLVALQLKEPLKFLEKNIPDLQKMSVLFMSLGTAEELREQIIGVALERAFLAEPLPKDEFAFKARIEEGRSRLNLIAQEVARQTGVVLLEFAAASRKLKDARASKEVGEDITAQLQRLIGKRFVTETPWAQLQHLPRYLKAISGRLDKLRADPARDAKLLAELRPLEQRYLRRVIELKGQQDGRLNDFRWQLEELRVSLFAQELRTPQPVSVKRLDKVWAQLQG